MSFKNKNSNTTGKSKVLKKSFALVISVILLLSYSGCSSEKDKDNNNNNTASADSVAYKKTAINDDMFSSRDMKTDYDESEAAKITLSDEKIQSSDNKNIAVSESTVTISGEGTYIITGKLTDGQIIVDAKKTDKLQLVLDNAEISSSCSAPLYIKQADKVFITLAENSNNSLNNNTEFKADGETNVDAVIFSKDDLTLNGNGKLEISTTCGHGIVSKDDLVITSGEYTVKSSGHALSGNDSIRIADGNFKLSSEKDGFHSENNDDTSRGFIYTIGGNFEITSEGDGLDSSAYTTLKNGKFNINAGGGVENATEKREEFNDFFNRFNESDNTQNSSDEDTISAKGIKANGKLSVEGGAFTINSADDALHSNTDVSVSGGTINITTGDDGIHADTNVKISSGSIDITQSYEGIEGDEIEISGGEISVVASDDGLNAAGGNDESGFNGGMQRDNFNSAGSSKLTISGGKIKINAMGDGIDSNGDLYVSGGEIYVSGPENGGNGALDYDGTAEISGGILVAAGNSTMAQNFGSSSSQGSILYNRSSNDNGDVILADSSGKTLVEFSPENKYNSVVVSCPDIKEGETYTLSMSGEKYTIEMTDIIYGSSNDMGGGFRGGAGGDSPDHMGNNDPNNIGAPGGGF